MSDLGFVPFPPPPPPPCVWSLIIQTLEFCVLVGGMCKPVLSTDSFLHNCNGGRGGKVEIDNLSLGVEGSLRDKISIAMLAYVYGQLQYLTRYKSVGQGWH